MSQLPGPCTGDTFLVSLKFPVGIANIGGHVALDGLKASMAPAQHLPPGPWK